MLEHVRYRVPVTAVAFYGEDVVLSGEGNLLRAYSATTQRVLASLRVFDDQSVHGIIVGQHEPRTVLVWGGSLIRGIQCDEKLALKAGSIRKATDWILDAALSPDEGRHLALLTAHNALSVTRTDALGTTDVSEGRTFVPVVPGSNCILYSAHIQWLSASQCLIASGTAFGDIIVCSARLSEEDGVLHAQAQTHYTFSAHEGSVFGVQLSGELGAGTLGVCTRVLASCSDDRTIRLWDVSTLQTDSPTLTESQRDTGFGTRSEGEPEEHAPPCLAKAMGHVSRIWQVRFIDDGLEMNTEGQQRMSIMSFGEDASNISWAVQPVEASAEAALPYELVRTDVETAHSGKHIWSVTMAPEGRFATGGADGAIAVRGSMNAQVRAAEIRRDLLGFDHEQDNFKAYSFISARCLVATTDKGMIVTITTDASGDTNIEQLSAPLPGLRGYSVVTSIPGAAFVAGSDGQVYEYMHESGRLSDLVKTGKKTAGLFACVSEHDTERHCVSLLFTSVRAAFAELLQLEFSTRSRDQSASSVEHQWKLRLSPVFIVTSCIRAFCVVRVLIILGARNGSIAAYHFSADDPEDTIPPIMEVESAHAREAVTSLHWTPADSSPKHCGFLHSTGRDGTHAVHRFELLDAGWKIDLVHQVALPFGPNVEGLILRPDDHLWIWGFQRKRFVVHDSTAQREVMSVECGGAHRTWAFQPGLEGGTFVWTQASKIYQHTQIRVPYNLLNSGGHGREVKAVAVSPMQPQLIATGAEDTDIKLSTFSEPGGFRCLQTLRRHNTGIQHLQWSEDSRYLFSSGGFEEFFVWKITLGVPGLGIGVVCESAHPKSGTTDLRIMGFDATHRSEDEGLQISMAYSDSTLKVWRYESKTWTLLAGGEYLTACLTQALCLPKTDGMLITTATDGHIATWEQRIAGRGLDWTSRHRVHQNAILAVALRELHDGSHLLITGGDDNAIGITRTTSKGDMQMILIPRAHAAAVTGLALLRRDQGRLLLASVSIDQRVKLWQIEVKTDGLGVDGISVMRSADVFTAVADVSSLELYKLEDGTNGILVCGVGMDMWRLTF
ncbi:hypothetical protein LTR85_009670 [Meristemomyces frigidus]|nr:hypothetical protein LTR85_009670 [Meristemomyces frigidus]